MDIDCSMLTSSRFINKIIMSVNAQFPKTCKCCGKKFDNFEDFLKNTHIAHHTNDHNIQLIDYSNIKDVIAFRNCNCNSTMTIKCILEKYDKEKFIESVKEDAKKLGVSEIEILKYLREIILEKYNANIPIHQFDVSIQPFAL